MASQLPISGSSAFPAAQRFRQLSVSGSGDLPELGEGIPFRDIAAAIARGAGVPAASISAADAGGHSAFLGAFVGVDNPTSSEVTRKVLSWGPERPGLIEDLDHGHYFASA